jgi:hypothetical protein
MATGAPKLQGGCVLSARSPAGAKGKVVPAGRVGAQSSGSSPDNRVM